ncbi:MAG: hypothetical protein AAGD35_03000 [Actinomycetota bacterium]
MEFLLEGVLRLLLGGAALGLAFASYGIWIAVRRRLWGLDQAMTAETPTGDRYRLQVERLTVRARLSSRAFGTDGGGQEQPRWTHEDRLHPDRMVDRFDEALIVLMPLVFVVVLGLALLFIVEIVLGVLILAVVAVVGTAIGHRWTCVVAGPDGSIARHRARGIRSVRRLQNDLAATIRAGDYMPDEPGDTATAL